MLTGSMRLRSLGDEGYPAEIDLDGVDRGVCLPAAGDQEVGSWNQHPIYNVECRGKQSLAVQKRSKLLKFEKNRSRQVKISWLESCPFPS